MKTIEIQNQESINELEFALRDATPVQLTVPNRAQIWLH